MRSFTRHQKHPTLEKVSTLTETSCLDTARRHGHEQAGAVAGAELKLMCLRGHCSGPTEERPTKSMSTRVLKIVIRNGKAKAATATGKRRVACGRMLGQGGAPSFSAACEPTRWPMRCRVLQGRPRTLSRQAPSLPVRSLGCTRHLTTASIYGRPMAHISPLHVPRSLGAQLQCVRTAAQAPRWLSRPVGKRRCHRCAWGAEAARTSLHASRCCNAAPTAFSPQSHAYGLRLKKRAPCRASGRSW